jgi:hypothetical protein
METHFEVVAADTLGCPRLARTNDDAYLATNHLLAIDELSIIRQRISKSRRCSGDVDAQPKDAQSN